MTVVWLDQKTRDRLSIEATPVVVPKGPPVVLYFERRPARFKKVRVIECHTYHQRNLG